MENRKLKLLEQKLTEEMEDIESIVYSGRFKGLTDWDKGYFNGKYLGLRYAIQEIEYALRKKGE